MIKKYLSIICLICLLVLAIVFFKTNNTINSKGYYNSSVKLKPYELWHIMRNYPYTTNNQNQYMLHMQQVAQQVQNKQKQNNTDITEWKTQGPYNIGGRINTIAHNPQNHQVIYVGSVCGGIHKTTNGGQTWHPVFDSQPYLAIGHIAVSPHDTNTIFAGTGDPNIGGYSFIGNGIYKSTDAGQTWQHLGLENTGIVSKIIVHPNNKNIIYAATMGITFIRDNNRGLYKSADGGKTWQNILFLSNNAGIIDMVMLQNSPDTIFVSGWNRTRNYNESILSGPECKIYRTFNGGSTWDTIIANLPYQNTSRINLECTSTNDSTSIYAHFIDNELYESNGIYTTNDLGQTWQKQPAQGIEIGTLGGFGWYFGRIKINPYNPKQSFLLAVDLFKSTDNMQTFNMSAPPWDEYIVHADKHDLVFIDSLNILLATDGGLYKSSDGGNNWTDIENIANTQFYRVNTDPHYQGFYCGGAQDNGTTYGNISNSQNWQRLLGGDGFQTLFDIYNPEIIYAETQNGNLYYGTRTPYYIDWQSFNTGFESDVRRSWDMPVCISSNYPTVMYTGTYRVYCNTSPPNGKWLPVSNDLTNGTDNKYHVITALCISPTDNNVVAAGTSDGLVHIGQYSTWQNITNNLPNRYVTDIFISPNCPQKLFVSHSGYKNNVNLPHIHFSGNLGKNWVNISGNLPQLAINSIYVMNGYNDSVIFVATDGGVYHTLNHGQTWERTGQNMPVVPVYDLVYDNFNHILVAGTFGRSIMTIELNNIIKQYNNVNIDGNTVNNLKIWPNPANSFININTTLINYKSIIHIYNYNGQVVKSINNLNSTKTNIDISNLLPGTYIIIVKSGNNNFYTSKLIKL